MNPMEIANELEDVYPEFTFKNHCYLRIAYDNVIQARWDKVIAKPFVIRANSSQVEEANQLLNLYKSDKELLLQHHKISLTYRNKIKWHQKKKQPN